MKEFKIFVAAALLFLLFDNAHSQDQPQHEQKTYVAENGKIYWNKYLPVYVKLATTSNGGEEHVMKVEPSKEDVEPFYFDTEGPNWIRTRWAVNLETGRTIYPKREILWPVFADGVSPVTSIKYHYTGKHVVKGKVYYSGDLKISLSAKDAVSGIEGTYYSIGNGYKKYDGQITVDTEKDWNFRFYSVDMVGNAESAEQVG